MSVKEPQETYHYAQAGAHGHGHGWCKYVRHKHKAMQVALDVAVGILALCSRNVRHRGEARHQVAVGAGSGRQWYCIVCTCIKYVL